MNQRRDGIDGPGRHGETDQRQRRILVVEDDVEIRTLMASVLTSEGYDVVESGDGIEALNYLAGSRVFVDDVRPADLVVADIVMPNFSGLDLLVGLRAHQERPPVVVVTGVADPDVRREARRLGAARVVAKPFGIETFVEAVGEALESGETTCSEGAGVSVSREETVVSEYDH